jgi:hypothetical protein
MLARRRNLFTIAPGAPFLKTFVSALLDGEIVPALSRDTSPLTMARATIYVPTQRAARALAAEFAQALDRRATLLPRILPLGALEERENAALFSADFDVESWNDACCCRSSFCNGRKRSDARSSRSIQAARPACMRASRFSSHRRRRPPMRWPPSSAPSSTNCTSKMFRSTRSIR